MNIDIVVRAKTTFHQIEYCDMTHAHGQLRHAGCLVVYIWLKVGYTVRIITETAKLMQHCECEHVKKVVLLLLNKNKC